MSNAIEKFLYALKRTIKGDPYPALQALSYAAITYRVANIRDPLVGTTLSQRYLLGDRVGSGSMSIVYRATQMPIDRVVAVKILKREWAKESLTVKRFYLEATAVSRLKHQNILTIHDVGKTDDGVPFFVMEFLEGTSLEAILQKYGGMHHLRALPIFRQICNAMTHAHKQGLIHRDLKPSNIMLVEEDDRHDFVKLVDFGIVLMTRQSQVLSQKLTQKGEIWGSPVYMSPEQCVGGLVDARSDIYSMGMVMYEVLVGKPAFQDKVIARIVQKQIKEIPLSFAEAAPGKSIPTAIETIVFKCIQKKPEHRYKSMEELEKDIRKQIPKNPRKTTTTQWFKSDNDTTSKSRISNPSNEDSEGKGFNAHDDVSLVNSANPSHLSRSPLPPPLPAQDGLKQIAKLNETTKKTDSVEDLPFARPLIPMGASKVQSGFARKTFFWVAAFLLLIASAWCIHSAWQNFGLPIVKSLLPNKKIRTIPFNGAFKPDLHKGGSGETGRVLTKIKNESKELPDPHLNQMYSGNRADLAEPQNKDSNNSKASTLTNLRPIAGNSTIPEESVSVLDHARKKTHSEHQAHSGKIKNTLPFHKVHSTQKNTVRTEVSRNKTNHEPEEKILEHIYLRKHRGDALQQWTDIKDAEQGN